MPRDGVLVMGFGGPDSLEAVGPFMCNLMGREPSDELVARVCERYEAIGGGSPLPAIAGEIAASLEAELARGGADVPVRVGMAYWHPFVAEGLDELRALGVERVITVSLSPFESKAATGACRDAVSAACDCLEVVESAPVSGFDAFVAAHALALEAKLGSASQPALVIFTAHSLPESDLDTGGDEYVEGLRRTADTVAERFGWARGAEEGADLEGVVAYGTMAGPQPWMVAYQSKGQKPGAWLGPELDSVIDAAAVSGFASVVVSPIGFLTDHMETLYDLDFVAAERAQGAGIEFARAAVPNADPTVVAAMAREVSTLL